jgi:hypothetical protein
MKFYPVSFFVQKRNRPSKKIEDFFKGGNKGFRELELPKKQTTKKEKKEKK